MSCHLEKASPTTKSCWSGKHNYKLGCSNSQDASHHQDYYTFCRGSYRLSFAAVTGKSFRSPNCKPLSKSDVNFTPPKRDIIFLETLVSPLNRPHKNEENRLQHTLSSFFDNRFVLFFRIQDSDVQCLQLISHLISTAQTRVVILLGFQTPAVWAFQQSSNISLANMGVSSNGGTPQTPQNDHF